MRRLLRSTALALALGFFLPVPNPVTGLVFDPAAYADPVTGKIPAWINAACCGPQDAHKLRADQVHRISDDFYAVDGYVRRIPAGQALPSQDSDYWIFYADYPAAAGMQASQSGVYCFFVPMAF